MIKKYEKLKNIIKRMNSVIVAFSGGCDSTLLMYTAFKILKRKAIAVTIDSAGYSSEMLEHAKKLAHRFGWNHIVLKIDKYKNRMFLQNSPKRCYYCKLELFKNLKKLCKKYSAEYIIDGSNYDDMNDYRPGLLALKKLGIRSPLIEAGLTKYNIREISKNLHLPTWNIPSEACLASRIPYGTKITKTILQKIEAAESIFRKRDILPIRVRYHNSIARIETSPDNFSKILKNKNIIRELKNLDFKYITLDLEGYRSGSMNIFT